MTANQTYVKTAQAIAEQFAKLPAVKAVALGGSGGGKTGPADKASDLDLYVYADTAIPVSARRRIARFFADQAELDNRFFEPGDEYRCRNGLYADIMYRTPEWIEDRLASVLLRHEACTGYTTCFWHNVLNSRILFDRTGWYAKLQESANRPYPAKLKKAIVVKNFPLLSGTISSYTNQVRKALKRADAVSVNHRVAAFMASYFDVLFAVNGLTHPGEKKLVTYALAHCAALPEHFRRDVNRALAFAANKSNAALPNTLERLAKRLEAIIIKG